MIPENYKNQNFWNAPPRQPHGDADGNSVYCAVGQSLTQWEQMEIALSGLFATLVESKSAAAARAYGGIASAMARKEQLERAGEVFFLSQHESLASEFDDVLKAFRHASSRRNDIAHGIVVSFADVSALGGGYYLIAPTYNSRRNTLGIDYGSISSDPFTWSETNYAYTSTQICEFGSRFSVIGKEVSNFVRKLRRPDRTA